MSSILRRPMIVLLLTSALLLCACQVPLPYLPVQLAVDEVPPASNEATPVPTKEEVEVGAENIEEIEVGAEAEDSQASATVIVRSLRIRSGPGVEHDVVAGANEGERFPVLGQAYDCQWLQVEHPTLGQVWLSGLPQYTTVDTECAQLAASDGSSVSEETPAPVDEESTPEADADQAADAAPTPEPEQESAESEVDTLPADQGCYLVQNYLGPELNITITAQDREWSDNFQIGEGSEVPYCLSPGRYTVTVDAPPPWGDLNDELTVQAGDRFYWPIRSGK